MMDIFPTVAQICGAALPGRALDGIDIWPMLSGAKEDIGRPPLLYFQNVHLECARWKNWKLHVSRADTIKWSPPPKGGVTQLMLPQPELYDLSKDVDESYDVAPEHPDIVARISSEMESIMRTFPPEIQNAYSQTKSRRTGPSSIGSVPSPLSETK